MKRAALVLALGVLACRGPRDAKPGASARPAVAGNRLNVLLITIDTLRADHLGAYGYRRATSPRMTPSPGGASCSTRPTPTGPRPGAASSGS